MARNSDPVVGAWYKNLDSLGTFSSENFYATLVGSIFNFQFHPLKKNVNRLKNREQLKENFSIYQQKKQLFQLSWRSD